MAATLTSKGQPRDGRGATFLVWTLATALVAASVGIAAYSFGGASALPGLSDLEKLFPLIATAGCLLAVFTLFALLTWRLLRDARLLRTENTELARLALVAAKTDNAAFITDPDGRIEWVNDGFVRLTGHTANEAAGKQPAHLVLGPLQNLGITQTIRDGVAHRRIFTVEMLCSNRRGHRYWMSLNFTPVVDDQGIVQHFIGIGSDITARRKAEDEIARVGKRSELLLNAAADGILGFDLEGRITFVNAATTRMTGFESPALIGQPISTIIRQLRVSRGTSMQDELLAGAAFIDGTVGSGDTDEFRRKDGASFPVEFSSTPVHEGETLIGSVVVFRDITTRSQAEAARTRQLRQAALRADVAFALAGGEALRPFLGRAMLALVKHLEGAFARVWTLHAADKMLELQASAGIYAHVNGPHSRIPLGTLKVGKLAQARMPQVSNNLLADPDILDKEWVARERMVAFIGYPLVVEGRLIGVMALFSRQPLPADALELFGCVADTIAQGIVRKTAEESGLRQAAILNHANDAIVVVGLDDRIQSWNSAADRLYDWRGMQQIGRAARDVLMADQACYDRARALAFQQGSWRDEFSEVPRADGQLVPVDSRWTLAVSAAGTPEALVIVHADRSTQRALEQRLLECQRGEVIGRLAPGLAHQLTDALSPILVSTQTLRARLTEPTAAEALELLERKARHGLDLARRVLGLGQVSAELAKSTTPTALLETVTRLIHDTFPKNIQIRTDAQEDSWSVPADGVLLPQAILNFAQLAAAQMPDGGALSITFRNAYLQEGAPELPNTAETGCYAVVVLEHTGPGLPDPCLALLETPHGTPLGEPTQSPTPTSEAEPAASLELDRALRSALHIVRLHAGFVLVGGALPGSMLSIYLRSTEPVTAPAPAPNPAPPPPGNGELILVVDDEESLLAITKEALESFGYRAVTAHDGAEAIATYSAHQGEVRLVITDMLMPEMDGPSTIRVLRKLDPGVPIIASSGMLEPAKVRELTGLDNLAFLEKPYTADTLRRCVSEQLLGA